MANGPPRSTRARARSRRRGRPAHRPHRHGAVAAAQCDHRQPSTRTSIALTKPARSAGTGRPPARVAAARHAAHRAGHRVPRPCAQSAPRRAAGERARSGGGGIVRRGEQAAQMEQPRAQRKRQREQALVGARPHRASIASRTSSALPALRPSTWSMWVTSADAASPAARATWTRLVASSRADAMSRMNAPLPTFTSSTSASSPAARFLLRIWR